MNLYQKLNTARLKLQNTELKKSGRNTHLKFDYFELQDFLPTINKLNEELGICTNFNLCEGVANLTLINTEKPEEVLVFSIMTAQAKLQGGASPIQEIGSLITYCRRYLYIISYEISENDILDGQIGSLQPTTTKPNTNPTTPKNDPVSSVIEEKHRKALYATYKAKGLTDEEFKAEVTNQTTKTSTKDLTMVEFKSLMKWLEAK